MRKDKIKRFNMQFFMIPFLAFILIFAGVAHFNVRQHINNTYSTIKKYTTGMSDSYRRRIANSKAARDIICGLVEDKLETACESLIYLEHDYSQESLLALAQRVGVDEINIFNKQGEVLGSTREELIGWKPYEDHPLYLFIQGGKRFSMDPYRSNGKVGIYCQYAYLKNDDNSYAQVGILTRKIEEFLNRFTIEGLIRDMIDNPSVENIFFTDTNFQLVASGGENYGGINLNGDTIHRHFYADEALAERLEVNGFNTLHVCTPVNYDGERLGVLTVVWTPDIVDKELKKIIGIYLAYFALIAMVLTFVLFYGYNKNKHNIKLAYYDQLTDLPNLEYLKEYLEEKIKESDKEKTALLIMTFTNFPLINITYGYDYGDKILKQVTACYKKLLGHNDMLFRIAAERFAIVIDDYKDIEELEETSQKIIEEFESPAYDMKKHGYLNLKIVICEINDPQISVKQVLHNAALGIADLWDDPNKDYVAYNEAMGEKLLREKQIEEALIRVIEGENADNFYMAYQPQQNLKTGEIVAFESLARLEVEGLGFVSPFEFIGLAERRNLIFPLGKIILEKTCSFLDKLHLLGHDDIKVAINISGLQLLRDDFIESFKANEKLKLANWKHLIFEITETVIFTNYDLVNSRLKEIKDMGGLVALDDFGKGFSSYMELHNLNIDILKVDRDFVRGIEMYEEDLLVTGDIISMAHKLNLIVVAEGVETEKQLNYLKRHGCDIMQGYYFSKPVHETLALDFLRSHNEKLKKEELNIEESCTDD